MRTVLILDFPIGTKIGLIIPPCEPGIIMADHDHVTREIQAALQNNDQALAAQKALENLKMLKNVRLNIAITGAAGAGKSTLVNALRGIRNKTEGAAPTGAMETTIEPQVYLHPQNPNIRIWDLPGVGTTRFTADEYITRMRFEIYDFFIIVSENRFRETDAKLAQEIQKLKKKFFFVRSKIDHNVRDEKEDDPAFSEEIFFSLVRNDCTTELQKLGCESPKVFLVSGLKLHLYEFMKLWENLRKELPEHQKNALLLALPNISLDVIEQKKKALWYKTIWYTLAAGVSAAVSVTEETDVSSVLEFTDECRSSLGLTPKSLRKLAVVTAVRIEDLRTELKSDLASPDEITRDDVVSVLRMSAHHIAPGVIERGARLIPVFGTVVAVGLSSYTTYKTLNYVLDSLAADAQQVFLKAMWLSQQ